MARKSGGSGIHIKASHKGELRRALGVPQGQPIPASKLRAAEHSSNPAVRKRAVFAENAKHFHHAGSVKQAIDHSVTHGALHHHD